MISKKQWIFTALANNSYDVKKVSELYDLYVKETGSQTTKDNYKRYIYFCFSKIQESINTERYQDDTILKLEASKQKLQDVNNAVRKTNREQYRIYNSLESIYEEYVSILDDIDLSSFEIKTIENRSSKVGIVHITDTHFNELIFEEEANGNSYDFNIASKRLKLLATESIEYFKQKQITEVHIFLTGDMINSSRRLGEKLAQCTSLVRASLLATYILQQFIIELAQYFNLTISSVVGNESRIPEEFESSDVLLSENFDYLIYHQLQLIFSKTSIIFNNSKNNSQCLVKIGDYNALLLHGNQFKSINAIEKDIAKIMQSYIYNGTKINGIFYGHFHTASCNPIYNRSGSLCGGNAYSTNELGYLTRASQNIYIINEDNSLTSICLDLQNTDSIEGYDIISYLERYNVRSIQANSRVIIENLT